jgi:glycerol-3-phosphate dehydrogenase
MVRFAARFEYARTVEDVLARRSRLLLLDSRAAHAASARVAEVLESETGSDPQCGAFLSVAARFVPSQKSAILPVSPATSPDAELVS